MKAERPTDPSAGESVGTPSVEARLSGRPTGRKNNSRPAGLFSKRAYFAHVRFFGQVEPSKSPTCRSTLLFPKKKTAC